MRKISTKDEVFQKHLKRKAIQWNTEYQSAWISQFHGPLESMVKSMKKPLYRVFQMKAEKKRFLADNQLRIPYEITGLLNTSPLTYACSDPAGRFTFQTICR